MKYSKGFNRDYEFYLKNKERFTFSGVKIGVLTDHRDGVSAKHAFFLIDTRGEMVPTCEPDLLGKIIQCKKSINLHIKMWVEGFEDMMEGVQYYMDIFIDPPPWVEDSFRKQLRRKLLQNQR